MKATIFLNFNYIKHLADSTYTLKTQPGYYEVLLCLSEDTEWTFEHDFCIGNSDEDRVSEFIASLIHAIIQKQNKENTLSLTQNASVFIKAVLTIKSVFDDLLFSPHNNRHKLQTRHDKIADNSKLNSSAVNAHQADSSAEIRLYEECLYISYNRISSDYKIGFFNEPKLLAGTSYDDVYTHVQYVLDLLKIQSLQDFVTIC